jgi:hypothetical protein
VVGPESNPLGRAGRGPQDSPKLGDLGHRFGSGAPIWVPGRELGTLGGEDVPGMGHLRTSARP